MKEEMMSLYKNQTYILIEKSHNQKIIKIKWVYKRKKAMNEVDNPKFKAKLVANGFT